MFFAVLSSVIVASAWYDVAIPVVASAEHPDQIVATGMLLNENVLLTANHVADGLNSKVTVLCGNDVIEGVAVVVSPRMDLAAVALRYPCWQHPFAEFADTAPALGTRLYVVGHPGGLFRAITGGIVSAYEAVQYPTGRKWSMVTDATVFGGNSGGPVFDANYKVVGITSAGLCLGRGACYGIIVPLSSIQAFLRGE